MPGVVKIRCLFDSQNYKYHLLTTLIVKRILCKKTH